MDKLIEVLRGIRRAIFELAGIFAGILVFIMVFQLIFKKVNIVDLNRLLKFVSPLTTPEFVLSVFLIIIAIGIGVKIFKD